MDVAIKNEDKDCSNCLHDGKNYLEEEPCLTCLSRDYDGYVGPPCWERTHQPELDRILGLK